MPSTFAVIQSGHKIPDLLPGAYLVLFGGMQEELPPNFQLRDTFCILQPNRIEHAFLLRREMHKPLLAHLVEDSTGALNIEACRVPTDSLQQRWPTNLLLVHASACTQKECVVECPCAMLDRQSGILKSGAVANHHMRNNTQQATRGGYNGDFRDTPLMGYGDSGGASRFFNQFQSREEAVNWLVKLIRVEG